ncbi:MAG: hypothetical protein ACYDCO_27415 [Armatimonadota bacterium]
MTRLLLFIGLLLPALLAWAAPFTVSTITPPEIVVQAEPADTAQAAAGYLQEAVQKMTGKAPPIVNKDDLSKGIILTTLKQAPALGNDPAVKEALKERPEDNYNAVEAFFIRTEKDRVLIVANTAHGLAGAVVELLESVNYEVLGLGPNWTCVPDYTKKPLVFDLTRAGRPGYYVRALWATSGQSYGKGTMTGKLKPPDEPVDVSYQRWLIGTRMYGRSMPAFPGHAMQAYHERVAEKMLELKTTAGFLAVKTRMGPEPAIIDPAMEIDPLGGDGDPGGIGNLFDEGPPPPDPNARPLEANDENKGWLWISTERDPAGKVKAFYSDGKTWERQDNNEFDVKLDLSVPFVREIVLEQLKTHAAKSFAERPDDLVILGVEPEDGGCSMMGQWMQHPNWYPEYCKAEGIPFGRPYVLHGYNGLDHPVETWDPDLQSNTIFGFHNWVLREMDQWIDAMPAKERVTANGKDKKSLLRSSGYSYNYHDVPPDFNLDPRVRVMIAGYPKHRGRGRWEILGRSHTDLAKALKVMLPREPSGDYRIISLSAYWDIGKGGIPAGWSAAPKSIAEDLSGTYQSGIKAMSMETDFNFGKFGLAYYLITKMLWNPSLTPEQLDAIRDRWFQRAYGSVWKEMKAYYDFMLKENYPGNTPETWAKAIRLIDAAQQKLDGTKEPEVQLRLDDLKQYWYFHYLLESKQADPNSPKLREFLWKGQMSYMVAMHAVTSRLFADKHGNVRELCAGSSLAADPDFQEVNLAELDEVPLSKQPNHFTHEETQTWWAEVLEFWKE